MGKFIRLVPRSVMIGFVNGLAIVIFLSQLNMFKAGGHWIGGSDLYTMAGLVALTLAILFVTPKIHAKAPGALISILIVTALVIFMKIDTANSFIFHSTKRWNWS